MCAQRGAFAGSAENLLPACFLGSTSGTEPTQPADRASVLVLQPPDRPRLQVVDLPEYLQVRIRGVRTAPRHERADDSAEERADNLEKGIKHEAHPRAQSAQSSFSSLRPLDTVRASRDLFQGVLRGPKRSAWSI